MLNPAWSTACPDWAERLVDRRSIIPPPIFPEEAERALSIFKSLRVSDLPGKPTFGECADQWVFDYVAAVFGGYDADTGKQLIREYGLLISKKNTKSTLAAGIMLTALILCWREEEEHLILAPTREVADNAFKPAAGMVRADEELMAMFHVQDHIRTITHRITRNSLKVVAADTDTVSGKKAGRVLVDELWVFGKKAGAEAMFMEALGGQVSRDEGWVIFLTTQSDDPPAGVFKDKLDYWRNVRDGKIKDNKTLGVLFEFPPEMIASKAYLNPENFYITNPNLGRSVSKEWLEDQLKRYRDRQDGAFQQFLAKHLNIEIGMNLRSDRWPGADFWQQQARKHITFEYLMENSEVITAGIDGGGLDDLLGLAFIGRHKTTGEWMGWIHAWAHPSVLERRKEIAARLGDFANDGDLTMIQHMGEDVSELTDMVAHVHQLGLLDKVGADPAGIAAILDSLEARGIPSEKLVAVSQGWLLMGTVKSVERRLASPQPNQSFVHADQPLMDWCVSNAKVVVSKAGYNISKAVSGTGKIDPVMALMDAAHLMALNPAAPKQSVYESRGIRFIRG